MSLLFKIDLTDEHIDSLPEGELDIILEYLENSLPRIREDVYNLRVGSNRIFVEREDENVWNIYRIEKDEHTTKITG